MDSAAAEMVRLAIDLRLQDLPTDVVRASKRSILDYLGVAIAGIDTPAAQLVLHCALLYGIAGHVLDFDDVTLEADAALHQVEAVVTIELRDGTSLTEHVEAASGTPANPMSDSEVQGKFLDLVEPVLCRSRRERLVARVQQLEDLPDIADLVAESVVSGRRSSSGAAPTPSD